MPKQVGGLNPAGYNPRRITTTQLEALRRAMAEFGDLGGIIINTRTGNLVGGHQRVKLLDPAWPIHTEPHSDAVGTVSVGYIDTPLGRWTYREVDWDETREKAANIAANRHGGKFEDVSLKKMLADIGSLDFDLTLTGFDIDEIRGLLGGGAQASPAARPGQSKSETPAPPPTQAAPQQQYPVQVILSREEHQRWTTLKNGLTDKAFILEMIKNVA